jgi:glycosyltransferase involved in cell wall biosynthesis
METVMADELISICIPTYNRLHYLQEAVASAQAQTHSNVEIVIANDGDNGELHAWCTDLAGRDSRVRYQKNERRLGLAGNWNAVARLARGTFLVIIGDDDRLLPEFVAKLLRFGREGTVLFSNHHVIDETGGRLDGEGARYAENYGRSVLSEGELSSPVEAVWRNSVPMSASLIRTVDVQRLGFKEDVNTPEIELFARLVQEGGRFFFTPEYLAEYRAHTGSATSSGLSVGVLARHLEQIAVPGDVETVKRAFLEGLLVTSVGQHLEKGDAAGARGFAKNRYYPSWWRRSPTVLLQKVVLRLPEPMAGPLYGACARAARRARALRRSA